MRRASLALSAAGIEAASHEARLLLAFALDEPAAALVDRQRLVDARHFDGLLSRRLAREPMAHIIGTQGFWTLDLLVSPATLIPRADSETLIEAAAAAFPDRRAVSRVLDLGTGTGCLLLAALTEFPGAFGIGVDFSSAAAAIARANATRADLASQAAFLVGDWSAPLGGTFDLVLANPPYIRADEMAGLMPEVSLHEPRLALDGGSDGLDAYRLIVRRLPGLLRPAGRAVLELGAGQEEALGVLAHAAGLIVHTVRPDLGGIPRAMVLGLGLGPAAKKPFGTTREQG